MSVWGVSSGSSLLILSSTSSVSIWSAIHLPNGGRGDIRDRGVRVFTGHLAPGYLFFGIGVVGLFGPDKELKCGA